MYVFDKTYNILIFISIVRNVEYLWIKAQYPLYEVVLRFPQASFMRRKKKSPISTRQKTIALFPDSPSSTAIAPGPLNHLYFGDCLDVLKELSKKEPFIDLIYIDPP